MQEIGSIYVGDGPKLMGGGIEAMTYAGLTPVVVTDPPFNIGYRYKGFKVGDKIVFEVLANEGYGVRAAARHPLNGAVYRIGYILDDFEGLAQKYVALAISKECKR